MTENQDTYIRMFELLQKERSTPELLKLTDDIITSAYEEIRSGSIQKPIVLDNMKRMLKEFRDRREKKVLMMAWDYSKTKSNLIDLSSMLSHEKDLYNRIVKSLEYYRSESKEASHEPILLQTPA